MRNNLSAFDDPVFEKKEVLRLRAIAAFDCTCQYCYGEGDAINGPDDRPWHLDRIKPGAAGGEYEPDNVTLACCACNCRKSDSKLITEETPPCLSHEEWLWERERYSIMESQREHSFKYSLEKIYKSTVVNDNDIYAGWTCT